MNTGVIVIIIVVVAMIGLIWYQSSQNKSGIPLPRSKDSAPQASASGKGEGFAPHNHTLGESCPECTSARQYVTELEDRLRQAEAALTESRTRLGTVPTTDAIKKQDIQQIMDPLAYPQIRPPRELLEKYQEYYDRTGTYPPFGDHIRPLSETPIMNGFLVRITDPDEAFTPESPSTIHLFRERSLKNSNRFRYYVIDQRQHGSAGVKIPLDRSKINGITYANAESYGLPEIFHDDTVENVPGFDGARFRVYLYRMGTFP